MNLSRNSTGIFNKEARSFEVIHPSIHGSVCYMSSSRLAVVSGMPTACSMTRTGTNYKGYYFYVHYLHAHNWN